MTVLTPFIIAPTSDAAADSDDERSRLHVRPFIRSDLLLASITNVAAKAFMSPKRTVPR